MVLVGYWPLNESSEDPDAPTAKDHSGNENHGTINDGGDSTVPGANGILGQNAYSFDGSSDYISISDDSSLDFQESLSLSVWAYPDGNGNKYGNIINRYSNRYWADEDYGFALRYSGDYNEWNAGIVAGGSHHSLKGSSVTLQKWIHLIMVYDGSNFSLYEDGRNSASTQVSGSVYNNTDTCLVGRGGGSNDIFGGRLSEVRVYDHALTSREIQYLYQVGKRGRQITSTKKS